MTPERLEQIEELYHAVREAIGSDREGLLAGADPELRREVESLLAEREGGEFMDRPAVQNARHWAADTLLAVGACLGPYRIERKIGEGGMGAVFQAVDTRLGRAVAIKTTREQFSARFEREARAIASLNHPNICTLHDVGPNYLVMELVEGETLAARLKRGPVPVETALGYASQIAEALVEAHGKGVVHRDLKPGNIMIAKSGIKVLDFGLAKSGSDDTVTGGGTVLGTPAYMSPEQREGRAADARSDIFSFGYVLHEMLTGARVTDRAVRLPSRQLERIVGRCLEANPESRWQSAAELARELKGVRAAGGRGRLLLAAAVVAVVLAAAAYLYSHRAPKISAKDTIVLADFENKTGDAVFDGTLRQGLAVELQQSPYFTLISDRKVQQTLALLGQPKQARLTSELAQHVCARTGSAAVLEGSIARVGSQYILGLRARACNTGDILDEQQAVAATGDDVVNTLSQIARKFRTGAGESLATVQKYSTPLAEATTSSLEALKAFSMATKISLESSSSRAAPFFRRAVELDPKFAVAHAYLGFGYAGMGESELSAESATRAWQLRDRVSDRERFFVDWVYERQVTGNLEKAYETLEAWLEAFPGEYQPHPLDLLGGISSQGTGRFERVIEVTNKRLAAEPDFMYANLNLAAANYYLGRFPEARSALRKGWERKLQSPLLFLLTYIVGTLEKDGDLVAESVAAGRDKPGAKHRMGNLEALALAGSGRLQAARQASTRAADLALQEGARETAATYQAARVVWEAMCGNAAEGTSGAAAALERSKGRELQYAAGLAFGFSGAGARAEALGAELEKRFPQNTFARFTYVPVLRGLAALKRSKPDEALERLSLALPYERAVNGLNFDNYYLGGLHSAYIRGEALVAMKRYAEAAAEFQKVLDYRGLVGLDPMGALAHLQLGRVHALSQDKAKAKAEYDRFLTLWEKADPGIPILKQARMEYARLQ